jgi:class 3 adenylate cyclase/predicted ATPase
MTFEEILDQALAMLQRRGRVTYSALKRQFNLDDAFLEDLKEELLYGQRLVTEEDGRVLVWRGGARPPGTPVDLGAPPRESTDSGPHQRGAAALSGAGSSDAERRQLTVLFCDLVDSTDLARQLDPEDLREVVRAYQDTCARVIARYDGHIAQYLGDGLLVYFGYPLAHEDDAQRAVRAGLGMIEALGQLNTRLAQEGATLSCRPSAVADAGNGLPALACVSTHVRPTQSRQRGVQLAVRLGIHTGLVVVGEVGGGTRQEQLALGETPNLAARLQGMAAPNTLVISGATLSLLGGFFACQEIATPLLKGFPQPIDVYQVLYESTARSRLEAAGSMGLTPFVGREQEVALLRERWAQVKDGVGQVVLLSGEAGIGKSRLVQVLKEHVASEPQAWLTPCQCSPYFQNTALYPMIDLLERVALQFDREEMPQQKLSKLEGFLVQYGLPLADTVPLFASLLSLPLGTDYAPLTVSPEQQKQRTLHALLTILLHIASQQPLLFVMEDLHWVDPTTLEFLSLVVDQGPTARFLALFTFRPDFSPPWTGRAHLTQVTLPRLPRRQAAEMTGRVAHGKALPTEVLEQVVAKTDGVPLFVEELTKMVLESGLLQEREEHYALTGPLPPLAIPTTLHDSLMARLDRLAVVKPLAQLGATLGREFSYELLQAVSPWDEATVGLGLQQLVEAEFLYQRGLPPQATYVFKHALIQDVAYQSLLKSTRQRHHQRIAQVLETRFAEVCEIQPELLAQHYTEAGLMAQAIPYWQRAGQRAIERSAYVEAISHLRQGLEVLTALPDTPARTQHELALQTTLGPALIATKGYAAPDVAQAYIRARQLCRQVGETPQLFPALWGLWYFYTLRAEFHTARELEAQCLTLAARVQDPALLLQAYFMPGTTSLHLGELVAAYTSLERAIALYDPQQHHAQTWLYGEETGVIAQAYIGRPLWLLGYPDQALQRSQQAIRLAQEIANPISQAFALAWATTVCQFRREAPATQERAEALMALSMEQGFPIWEAYGRVLWGWALAAQGQSEEGIAQMRRGHDAWQATGAEVDRPYFLVLLAEAYGNVGQVNEGLGLLAAVSSVVDKGERYWEAELYRVKGELLLVHSTAQHAEAETHLQQTLTVARRQQAKSLELRAAMSLSRLWQQQGKRQEAHDLLAPIYGWFTEGFDTADLQEARTLLAALREER